MKLEVTELSDLFMVIDREMSKTNIKKTKHKDLANAIKSFAMQSFMLGKNGKIIVEVSE